MMNQPVAKIVVTPAAQREIAALMATHTGRAPTRDEMHHALKLTHDSLSLNVMMFQSAQSMWHEGNPVHAFEALTVSRADANDRYAWRTLNLHYVISGPGEYLIGTTKEFPLTEDYFVQRVQEEARIFARS
jgi:hypothetical protein